MFHPEKSKHFTRHRDPESGVESWILTDGVAPYQQAFYFVNDSFSGDGRYLWFYCGFPPSRALPRTARPRIGPDRHLSGDPVPRRLSRGPSRDR